MKRFFALLGIMMLLFACSLPVFAADGGTYIPNNDVDLGNSSQSPPASSAAPNTQQPPAQSSGQAWTDAPSGPAITAPSGPSGKLFDTEGFQVDPKDKDNPFLKGLKYWASRIISWLIASFPILVGVSVVIDTMSIAFAPIAAIFTDLVPVNLLSPEACKAGGFSYKGSSGNNTAVAAPPPTPGAGQPSTKHKLLSYIGDRGLTLVLAAIILVFCGTGLTFKLINAVADLAYNTVNGAI